MENSEKIRFLAKILIKYSESKLDHKEFIILNKIAGSEK